MRFVQSFSLLVKAGWTGVAVAAVFLAMLPPAYAETLEEALAAAYEGNPTLRAERARLRATDEEVPQALSGWRPTVTATGNYGTQGSRSSTPSAAFGFPNLPDVVTVTSSRTRSADITVTQPLFRGGQTWFETKQAIANVEAGRATLMNVEQQVLLDTITAYMDVVRDEATVRHRRNNVQVLERRLEAERHRFQVGENTRTDVAQAEARLSRAKSDLTDAQAQLVDSRAAYERIVGHAPGTLDTRPPLPPLPDSEEQARDIAVQNNPTLLAAIQEEEASRHAITVAKGTLLPSADFVVRHRESGSQRFDGDNSINDTLEVQLTVPLYQAGAEYSRIREAKQINSQRRLQIAQARREVTETVASSWALLQSATARIVSAEEEVQANEIALEGVEQEMEVGERTTLDVLDAEQELLDSRLTLVESQRDEYVAAYSLLSAIGSLTAKQLDLPVDLYDPTRHYKDVKYKFIGFGPSIDD